MVDPQLSTAPNPPADPVAPSDMAASPTPVAPADPSAVPGGDQQSPLDILEEILGNAKAQGGAVPSGATAPAVPAETPPPDPNAPPPEPPGPTAEEIEALEAQYAVADQAAAAAKSEEIKAEAQTVAEHDQATAQPTEAAPAQDGFDIKQLTHTKI